jgi:hypothetical protein
MSYFSKNAPRASANICNLSESESSRIESRYIWGVIYSIMVEEDFF